MPLTQQVQADLKQAMLDKDEVARDTLRMLKSELTKAEIDRLIEGFVEGVEFGLECEIVEDGGGVFGGGRLVEVDPRFAAAVFLEHWEIDWLRQAMHAYGEGEDALFAAPRESFADDVLLPDVLAVEAQGGLYIFEFAPVGHGGEVLEAEGVLRRKFIGDFAKAFGCACGDGVALLME